MGVTSYGAAGDALSSPSLPSWAAAVAAALDNSDTSVNTRLAVKAPIASPTFTGTVTLPDATVTPTMLSSQGSFKAGGYTLTSNDNVITTSGAVMTLPDASAAGIAGRIFTIRNIGPAIATVARTASQTVDGCTGTITIPGKGTMTVISDGSNWVVLSAQYTDESIGRRVYTWDSAIASGSTLGWQLTYSDTGWRDVSADLLTANGYTSGLIKIRRQGSLVYTSAMSLTRSSAGASLLSYYQAPVGFRVENSYWAAYSSNSKRVMFESTGHHYIMSPATSESLGSVYVTNDSWPASLPGSASGSIPT